MRLHMSVVQSVFASLPYVNTSNRLHRRWDPQNTAALYVQRAATQLFRYQGIKGKGKECHSHAKRAWRGVEVLHRSFVTSKLDGGETALPQEQSAIPTGGWVGPTNDLDVSECRTRLLPQLESEYRIVSQ
jgi:hypothetical protein